MTEKKKTIVFIIGVCLICLGIFFTLDTIPTILLDFKVYVNNFVGPDILLILKIFETAFAILAIIGLIVSGIFILFLKRWARSLGIYSCLIILIEALFWLANTGNLITELALYVAIVFTLPIILLFLPSYKAMFTK